MQPSGKPNQKQLKDTMDKLDDNAIDDNSTFQFQDENNNQNIMNLRASDGYGNFNVFSESDEELPGKRVRIYSYDPDINSQEDAMGKIVEAAPEPKYKSHVQVKAHGKMRKPSGLFSDEESKEASSHKSENKIRNNME